MIRALLFALLAFTPLASYEIARPASESIFLSAHGAEALPKAWLLVALGATLIIGLYNLFAARVALPKLMASLAGLSAAALIVLKLGVDREIPGATYLLYLWKDLYIVLLIEVFWTIANASLSFSAAKWIYGLLCAAGSLGSITGARLLQHAIQARGLSTPDALLWTLPFLALIAVIALALGRAAPVEAAAKPRPGLGELREGLRIFRESPYLSYLLLLILLVQLIITLVDYQFNAIIQAEIPDKAARTVALAQVYERISYGALAMQLLTGIFIATLGLRGAMLLIPGLIFTSIFALILYPSALMAAAAKITGKVLDYSLFRAAKELLYLPLSYREKTQGKAIIDMLTYRIAKGGVALLLQGLIAGGLAAWIGEMTLVGVVIWVVLIVIVLRRHRALTSKAA
ncbi:hypothetical protein KJ940_13175 [Myxococcota bacterium]|nr:hypothetical protein [Myxococcota bacterium]